MRQRFTLNVNNPTANVNLTFYAALAVVDNPSASNLFMRLGAPDAPQRNNADRIVGAGNFRTVDVVGSSFGLTLENPSAANVTTGAISPNCVVEFLSADEIPPAAASSGYISLAQSTLGVNPLTAVSNGVGLWGPFDLQLWGGLIALLSGVSTGATQIIIQVSEDLTTWQTAYVFGIMSASNLTIQIPRFARYIQLLFAGPPQWTGANCGVVGYLRPTLSEIIGLTTVPTAGPNQAVNIPASSFATYEFYVGGASAVEMSFVPSNTNQGTLWLPTVYEYSADPNSFLQTKQYDPLQYGRTLSWTAIVRTNTGRLQLNLSNRHVAFPLVGYAYARPIYGESPTIERAKFVPIGANDGEVQTLGATTDLRTATSVIGLLKQADTTLGDTADAAGSANVIGQSKSIKLNTDPLHGDLTTLSGNLGTINTSIGTTNTSVGAPADAINANTLMGQLKEVVNGIGDPTHGAGSTNVIGQIKQAVINLASIITALGTLNTNTPAKRSITTPYAATIVCGAGIWALSGFTVPAGKKILMVVLGSNTAGIIAWGLGTAGGVVSVCAQDFVAANGSLPPMNASGDGVLGIDPGANTTVWILSNVAATLAITVWVA